MNFFLEIATLLTESSDHHIGADAAFRRDVAIGIGQTDIGRIVNHCDADLLFRGGGEKICLGKKGLGAKRKKAVEQKKEEENVFQNIGKF